MIIGEPKILNRTEKNEAMMEAKDPKMVIRDLQS